MPQISGVRNIRKKDFRTFSHEKRYGSVGKLPYADFEFDPPLVIKDQDFPKPTDLCTAAAVCAIAESEDKVPLSMEWFFAKEREETRDWRSFGVEPLTACKAALEYGFIRQDLAPFNLAGQGRDFCANWNNWPLHLDVAAKPLAKKSYFDVFKDISTDKFDALRSAMLTQKKSVFVGAWWQPDWISAPQGVIPKEYRNAETIGHAFKIFGQESVNGELCLKAQLSEGTRVGRKGIFYFPREIANRFLFAYVFADEDPEVVKQEEWNILQKIYDWLVSLLARVKKNP